MANLLKETLTVLMVMDKTPADVCGSATMILIIVGMNSLQGPI